ncbi:MAG: Zn-dependent alcohol dehydrogenase [Actinomycetota bacterium]
MKAAVLHSHGEPLKVEDIELAPPQPGEVKIKISATGVCHSDLSARNGTLFFPVPCVPGHEAAGIVTEVGEGVTKVSEGDHVVVCWIPYCGECWYCRRGEMIHCDDVHERHGLMKDRTTRLSIDGMPLFHGLDAATFAEEAVLNDTAVIKIDDDMPLEIAALIGCGVTTGVGAVINTAKVPEGSTVAVIGCGGVGLNVIQGARIAGASKIIAVDVVSSKLDAARKFGATDTVDASSVSATSATKELADGVGVDYAFEVIGNTSTIDQAMQMTRRGGYAVLVGVAPFGEQISITPSLMTLTGRSVLGCYFGSTQPERDFPKMVELWREGKLDLEGLISERGGLEDINSAFEAMDRGSVLRTVITP